MAVSKTTTGIYTTLEGTLSEVITQLNTDGVPRQRVSFLYDAGNSKVVAIYHV